MSWRQFLLCPSLFLLLLLPASASASASASGGGSGGGTARNGHGGEMVMALLPSYASSHPLLSHFGQQTGELSKGDDDDEEEEEEEDSYTCAMRNHFCLSASLFAPASLCPLLFLSDPLLRSMLQNRDRDVLRFLRTLALCSSAVPFLYVCVSQ